MQNKPNFILTATMSAILAMMVTACKPSTEQETNTGEQTTSVEEPMMPEGPHAPADRLLAERKITSHNGVHRIDIDFGNTEQGKFSAPARGILITPAQTQKASPLIVISHLRSPNCLDKSSAYPCNNTEEIRYDRGMVYLGEHLAKQGYTVIIPDLGGIFIGADVSEPYDQGAMWQQTVGNFVNAIKTDAEGKTNIFDVSLPPVDFSKVGLFVHSRSGQMVDAAQTLFGKDNLKGIFAYAPAYDTIELEFISPAPADIPYLAVVGSLDADVGSSANLWLGHYSTTPRQSAASVVELPGLGHMYVNRATSEIGFDDRIGCDVLNCLDAKAHEDIALKTVTEWFNATLEGKKSDLPTSHSNTLPNTIANLPARWLSLTPKALAFVEPKDWTEVNTSQPALVCAHTDPMNPVKPADACQYPDIGVVQILTHIAKISQPSQAKVNVQGAKGISLQVSPTGSYQGVKGTAVTLTLGLDNQSTFTLELPADHPALVSRYSENDNGTYQLGTVRVALPDSIAKSTITSITLDPKQPIYVRSVDFW